METVLYWIPTKKYMCMCGYNKNPTFFSLWQIKLLIALEIISVLNVAIVSLFLCFCIILETFCVDNFATVIWDGDLFRFLTLFLKNRNKYTVVKICHEKSLRYIANHEINYNCFKLLLDKPKLQCIKNINFLNKVL